MDELRALFRDFTAKAKVAVLNLDNEETAALASAAKRAVTYSLGDDRADLCAQNIQPAPDGIAFDVIFSPPPRGEVEARSASGGGGSLALSPHPKNPSDFSTSPRGGGCRIRVTLRVPGRHNVSNALAALAAAYAAGVPLEETAAALQEFKGVRRRLEVVGTAKGVTVIDDFAHNPDKIAATLSTLHDFPGRLLVMFQPHGFSPLMKMRREFVDCFARNLGREDILIMPEPVYFGGTTTRSVTSADIAEDVRARGRQALSFADRAACGKALLDRAGPGDRIVVMGARDDTLTQFAGDLLRALA
jgi:UDP-N-acetylmuramate--alanine ligase